MSQRRQATVLVTAVSLLASAGSLGAQTRVQVRADRDSVTVQLSPRSEVLRFNDRAAVPLRVGDTLDIALASNPTTGYSWSVADSGEVALRALGKGYRPDATSVPPPSGSGGVQTWLYVASARGAQVLRFVYARDGERGRVLRLAIAVQ